MTSTTPRPLPTRIAFALLWLYVFTLPLTQLAEFPAFGAVSRLVGALALAAGVGVVAARKQIRLLGAVHVTIAGFILWSAVTLCWSVAPDLTAQRIMTYLQLFMLVLLVWELCVEEKDVLHVLSAFVLGTMIPALSTLQAFLPGQKTLYERAAAGMDSNSLAFVLALSLPVSYYLILRDKGVLSAFYRLQMGCAVCAILMSGSAATLIAMATGLSLVFWTVHAIPVRTRINVFAMMMVIAGATLVFIPSAVWKHLEQETRNSDITLTAVMNSGAGNLQATPPGGFGAGSLPVAAARAAASTQFAIFSETGVVGVACFLVMLSVLFLAAEGMTGPTKSFWFTVLAVWAVGACALNWECCQPAWLLFGLLASHSASLKQEGVTQSERGQKQRSFVGQGTEVWS